MVLPTDLKNLLIAYEKRILALEELTQKLREKLNETRSTGQESEKGANKKRPSKKSTKES